MQDNRLPATNNGRLLSLDVLRGLTVAGMVLVTDPGTYNAVYPQLLHVPWQGAHVADMIFPAFLVMVGVSMALSLAKRMAGGAAAGRLWLHLLRRSGIMVVLGLLVNGFPDYHLHTLRLPGILQRIGICYLLAGSLYLPLRSRLPGSAGPNHARRLFVLGFTAAGLLAVYTLLLRYVTVPGFGAGRLDSYGSLPACIDRLIFGVRHLWPFGTTAGVGVTFDPEGLLSTIPALATTLLGVFAGELLPGPDSVVESGAASLRRGTQRIAMTAAVLLGAGLISQPYLPWIKKIYTGSFACFSAGVALALLALLLVLIEQRRWRRGLLLFRIFGTNAILAFVLSGVITTLLDRLRLESLPAHQWMYEHLFTGWVGPDARFGSLLYALAIVGVNALLLWPLYRRGKFIRL